MSSFFFDGAFTIMFTLTFVLIVGTIIMSLIRGISQWNKNNNSPRLTVNAKVVAKRTRIGRQHRTTVVGVSHSSGYTDYYVTFEVESGDRMELAVNGNEFGMLVEGDMGKLSFQGTRYLGFTRTGRFR